MNYYDEHEDDSYYDGQLAFTEGGDNPHSLGSYLHARWELGFMHASEEDADLRQEEREAHWSER